MCRAFRVAPRNILLLVLHIYVLCALHISMNVFLLYFVKFNIFMHINIIFIHLYIKIYTSKFFLLSMFVNLGWG